jgi:hypothetical protein
MNDKTTTTRERLINQYAWKAIEAAGLRTQNPRPLDVSDEGLAAAFAGCVRPARPAELAPIRARILALLAAMAIPKPCGGCGYACGYDPERGHYTHLDPVAYANECAHVLPRDPDAVEGGRSGWLPFCRALLVPRSDDADAPRAPRHLAGMFVDTFTASMMVQIHDALNEKNRAAFAALPLEKAVPLGWKLLDRANA